MSDITVEEAKKKKDMLCLSILGLIEDFEKETGLRVESINSTRPYTELLDDGRCMRHGGRVEILTVLK